MSEMQINYQEGYFRSKPIKQGYHRGVELVYEYSGSPSRVIAEWDLSLPEARDLALDLLDSLDMDEAIYNTVKEALG